MRKVLLSGMFDLFHTGHLGQIEATKKHGDYLVVHVASDKETRAVKGVNRPIIPGRERAEIVLALKAVNEVIYEEDYISFNELLDSVKPDVVIRNVGGNLEGDEELECKKRGIEIVRLDRFPTSLDTTAIIKKIAQSGGDSPKPIGINYVLQRPDGKILLQKRDDKPEIRSPGAWCFPGGMIEPQEDALVAAVREVKEETGLDIHYRYFSFLTDLTYPWGDRGRFFLVKIKTNEVQSNEGKMSWHSLEEIKTMKLAANQADIIPLIYD